MNINRMRLVNYRNYKDISPNFSPNINILYGNNGQGKTNLLEAIFLMLRGYSHRASSTKELINFDENAMYCVAEFRTNQTNHNLSLKAQNTKKGWKLDNKAESSFSKIQNLTGCILFEPDDLEIVKGNPDRRRKFINMELSGLVSTYRSILKDYERIRHQRNAVIKQARLNNTQIKDLQELLNPWNTQLIDKASRLLQYRNRYLKRLAQKAQSIYTKLAGSNEKLELAYKTNIFDSKIPDNLDLIRKQYNKVLINELAGDLERGYTRFGPHNDDLEILINGNSARYFASQGQQRTAAISLKLAHIDLYKEILNITPIVLLDDILSELDSNRQKNILSVLSEAQTFITCTDPSFSFDMNKDVKLIKIKDGNIL